MTAAAAARRCSRWLPAAVALSACAAAPVPTAAKPTATDTFEVSFASHLDVVAAEASAALGDVSAVGEVDVAGQGAPLFSCQSPGAAGCACKENAECNIALCLATPDGPKCALPCVDKCPGGYKCASVTQAGAGDVLSLCVPRWGFLCDPCTSTADCSSVGLSGALCIDRGAAGRFCGAACATDAACPGDYQCADVTATDGLKAKQCMRAPAPGGTMAELDGFGACPCSPRAQDLGLETKCYVSGLDKDGKVTGLCKGVRACGKGGLLACSAVQATSELCNGDDDDCDGQTDEAACDDQNACTTDACDPKSTLCGHTPTPGACDADQNACTEGDQCKDGACAAGPVKDCGDGNGCTLDACDPASGCTQTASDGAPCDDANGCTLGDTCSGKACQPGAAKVCAAAGPCTTAACDAKSGACAGGNQPDGSPCDDASQCTGQDVCKAGICAGSGIDCEDKNGCTLDACQFDKGCVHTAASSPCDDQNACTAKDTCKASMCAGVPKDVSVACDDGEPCTTDACDVKLGCVQVANAAKCDDGNACTTGDVCQGKACKAGTNTCQCQVDADCAAVEDGNLCNGTLYCDKSTAQFQCKVNVATVVVCEASADTACKVSACDLKTAKCAPVAVADAKPCDADGTPCTVGDACKGGACVPGKALDCNDGNVCTGDACDTKQGCTHTPNSAACNADDSLCTVNDACSATKCVAGAPKNCADTESCTADTCDPKSGACKHDGAQKQGEACAGDANLCTGPDTCKCAGSFCAQATCVVGPSVDCDDKNPCTLDGCEAKLGCTHPALADQAGCGVNQWCLAGKCVPKAYCGNGKVDQPSEECDDGNQISGDGCSAQCKKEGAKLPLPGQLVITEIMADPTGPDDNHEWFEVLNVGPAPVQLTGIVVKDNVGQEFIAKPGLVLAVGAYFVFGSSATPGGYSADYAYSYGTSKVQLANAGDEVSIVANGQVIDVVVYTGAKNGWKTAKSGASYQLRKDKLDAVSNDLGANWCFGTAAFGTNGDLGTPGKVNGGCP